MICRTCNHIVPDGVLACPACSERASLQAFLEMQRALLPRFLSGEYPLTLGRANNSVHAHIQLIGESKHAWCGAPMNHSQRWQRIFEELDRTISLCAKCRAAIHKMAAEVTPKEVA